MALAQSIQLGEESFAGSIVATAADEDASHAPALPTKRENEPKRPLGTVPIFVTAPSGVCSFLSEKSEPQSAGSPRGSWLGRQDSQPKLEGYDIKGLGPRSTISRGIGPGEWTIRMDPGQRCGRGIPQTVKLDDMFAEH